MQKEIFEINYKGYIAYSIGNIVFDLSGKIYKSIRAFKNYIGSCKGLPQNGKQNSCYKISGATHYILQVFNNLKWGKTYLEVTKN